ncbi:MAG: RND transporter [Nitrosomonadaceae bacterium]|nr:RND transporter [Nitrosomonadaceae bacterium]
MRSRLKLVYLLLVTVLTQGCVMVGPDYKRSKSRDIVPINFTINGITEEKEKQIDHVSSTWWELYKDPVLNDLVSKALENNSDIKIAIARVEEADAYLQEIGAALFPTIDLQSNVTRSRISKVSVIPIFPGLNPVRQIYGFSIGTAFELDFWGKIRRSKEAASAQALGTYYARDTVYLSLASLVSTNYLVLRGLDAQLSVSRDNLRNRKESLNITRQLFEQGLISALDVYQAETAHSNIVAQISDLSRQRAICEHQLAVLTGVLDLHLEEGNIKTLPIPPIPPAGLPSSLLEARPDVRQAEEQVIAATAKIGVAKASLFPSIMLTTRFGRESITLGNIVKSAANIWTAGVNLNLPIFDAGRLLARLDQANAQQKQTLASYENSIRTAFREVNDALISVRKNSEQEIALQASEDSAKKALKISVNRYKLGYSAYLEVLDAQRIHNDAALAVIRSRQNRLIATVDLFKALGGGWESDVIGRSSVGAFQFFGN